MVTVTSKARIAMNIIIYYRGEFRTVESVARERALIALSREGKE
tara:strand:- start:59 stop:190 length:132 start_codon:yes stop_codon:yes gene_type:complete